MTEIVLYQGEDAKRSHQRLFSLDEDCYLGARQSMTEAILLSAGEGVVKLHIVTGWLDMLKVALWMSARPPYSAVIALIGNLCRLPEGLISSPAEDAGDIFPKLYNDGRLDVFRRVCRTAKSMTELKVGSEKLQVHCHLVGDVGRGIVASSL